MTSGSGFDQAAAVTAAREAWQLASRLAGGVGTKQGALMRLGKIERGTRLIYPQKTERELSAKLPPDPAAIRIYGNGMCRALFFDLDTKNTPAHEVEWQTLGLMHLLEQCGGRPFSDSSPNGGRHVYLPLEIRLSVTEAVTLVEAAQLRFSAIDPSPHRNARHGCIRPPGSKHKSGGYQTLDQPPDEVLEAFRHAGGYDVIEKLTYALKPQIERRADKGQAPEEIEPLDNALTDGAAPGRLSQRMRDIAIAGWDGFGYPSASEARMAVLTGAAAVGYAFHDVVVRIEHGIWPGLAGLYATKYTNHNQRAKALSRDWHKAQKLVATNRGGPENQGRSYAHKFDTSHPISQGGTPTGEETREITYEENAFIRTWLKAAQTHHRRLGNRYVAHFVVEQLALAAIHAGKREIAWGCRSLSLKAGCSPQTVAQTLKNLEKYGWLKKIGVGRGRDGDTYRLTLPADLTGAEKLRWLKGRIHGLRPAFRVLGPCAAMVFAAIEQNHHTTAAVIKHTGLSRNQVAEEIKTLHAHGAIEHTKAGWIAKSERLDLIAEDLGVLELIEKIKAKIKAQRHAWWAWLNNRHNPAVLTLNIEYDEPPPWHPDD